MPLQFVRTVAKKSGSNEDKNMKTNEMKHSPFNQWRIEKGLSYQKIAEVTGIAYNTIARWGAEPKDGDKPRHPRGLYLTKMKEKFSDFPDSV